MSLISPVFLAFIALVVVTLLPVALALRRPADLRGRRDSAVALHRAQLAELDREHTEGRIGDAEHQGAKLELQRRLLAVDQLKDRRPTGRGMAVLMAALLLVPIMAETLYRISGHPELPDAPAADRRKAVAEAEHDADKLITTLRVRLAAMGPHDDLMRQGQVLLGNAEASRGHLAAAAAAWRAALDVRFEATLAVEAAETQYQIDQRMTPETEALFRKALAAAPPDAQWRGLVQERLGS